MTGRVCRAVSLCDEEPGEGRWRCDRHEYQRLAHQAGDCAADCFLCHGSDKLLPRIDPDREEWREGGNLRDDWSGELLEDVDGYPVD